MSEVELYIDYLSQPSRAVLSLCIAANIPHRVVHIELVKGGVDQEDFKKVSPMRVVPAIKHGDFTLFESHAIMIYLATVFRVPDHWFPKDNGLRAKVNTYLHWHHLNIRYGIGYYYFIKFFRPLINNKPVPRDQEEEMLIVQARALKLINSSLQTSNFIAGTAEVSIADLSCFAELEQMQMMDFDFSKYAGIYEWQRKMRAIEGVRQAHEVFYKTFTQYKL